MRKKIFIIIYTCLFLLSMPLYGESAGGYKKNLQIGVNENGQTVKESITIYDEPKAEEAVPTEQVNNDYIYVNPYYNGYYPNYNYPTYYPNYYNGYGGRSYYGSTPMVFTYSLTGIKYDPYGRVVNPGTRYNPPPPPPPPNHHKPNNTPPNNPSQSGAGHHNGGAHPNRH